MKNTKEFLNNQLELIKNDELMNAFNMVEKLMNTGYINHLSISNDNMDYELRLEIEFIKTININNKPSLFKVDKLIINISGLFIPFLKIMDEYFYTSVNFVEKYDILQIPDFHIELSKLFTMFECIKKYLV